MHRARGSNDGDFFSVLQDGGYSGAMSIEQEHPVYGAENNPGPDFSEDFKLAFLMARRYLSQYYFNSTSD
jgi:sugar phosphate isomerase/epimerase